MSSNVYNGKNLFVDGYVRLPGRPIPTLPPMLLPPECGERPKDPPGAVHYYTIGNFDGASVDLVGWEGIMLPICILKDALHRDRVRAGIRSPSPEQLDQLRDLLEKLEPLIPPESEQR